MIREGFEPDLPPAARKEIAALAARLPTPGSVRDLRPLPWSSIDNPESRDLDQVECAERMPNGCTKVMVGIADVDSRVAAGTAIDRHAAHNTTSVYCGVATFPMLPAELSTDLTSLNRAEDRLAVVIELIVEPIGTVESEDVYPALVRNQARLDYPSVGAWLEGGSPPPPVAGSVELAEQLRLQVRAAEAMRGQRYRAGALDLDTIEATPVAADGKVVDVALHRKDRATNLIEDFMIAANVAMARFLEARGVSSIRRVVKAPERWDRIVALALALGEKLPAQPDSGALAAFMTKRRAADPDRFPDLSLSVVKLMGPGEYTVERPDRPAAGHFGLAVQDYTHSTAPNRRFADLVTQRLLKAVLSRSRPPYSDDALEQIAARCTKMEDAARKVERTCRKQAAAELLAGRIGQRFEAIVTGVNANGTFVRILHPHAEGMVVRGQAGMDVGDRVVVQLVGANPERGFIDFAGVRELPSQPGSAPAP